MIWFYTQWQPHLLFCRSQPYFFALMVNLLAEENGEKVLLKYKTALGKEYSFWMQDENMLNYGKCGTKTCSAIN